ncbi:hypothetical protein [Sphingomonas sanguinis]|jgi:hypothetical protein|uniref:STAS/SEC14 domain-containing protein n=1 Tax=Sphingomonas sanguinis TaxID=33051 RepID=A0A7Y7QYA6_9SPHN|nr:hypothetical protein [Sphingomonas sanguinis]MBZ6383549.1 hypothetical protein [Sphingomonas sanguinis]NNG50525.1 hypothetical protein [Sphingomonas sanguinis]NNG55064.1 hypothetical protein [Sphingomonas sanguinis]NVP32843.1 hypothetical protein [Sphingomonas sanguinis]
MRIEDPSFTVWIDDRHVIHVHAQGTWSAEIADRYWRAFGPFLEKSRRHFGFAKVLVDRRGAPVMPPALIQAMRDGILAHYRQDDWLALVVDSSPLKSQARQNYPLEHLEAFLSYDAALAWLTNA